MVPWTRMVFVGLICSALVAWPAVVGAAQDVPTCFDLPATIVGTDGNDVLQGTAGADVIVGLDGGDLIRGGDGNDVICAGPNPTRYIPKFGPGGDAVLGEGGDDLIAGGPGFDELDGGPGNDVIFIDDPAGAEPPISPPPSQSRSTCHEYGDPVDGQGNDGWQAAVGGLGDDVIFGGRDHAQLWGDETTDLRSFNPPPGTSGGDDVIRAGSGDDCIRGGPGDDLIDAGSGADVLKGGVGDDRLLGRSGNDQLRGNAGADDLRGGAGSDRNFGGKGSDVCGSPSHGVHARSCQRPYQQ